MRDRASLLALMLAVGCADDTTMFTSEPETTTDGPPGTTAQPGTTATTVMTTSPPSTSTTSTTSTTDPDPTTTTGVETTSEPPPPPPEPICVRLGGMAGVNSVVKGTIAQILADERINAYFLNQDVDGKNFGSCLARFVGEVAECPGVIYDCADMTSAHAGMGISTVDFFDFVEDFNIAVQGAPGLTFEDRQALVDALLSQQFFVVEDHDSDASLYQRLVRKEGIKIIVGSPVEPDSLLGRIYADPTLDGFFGGALVGRLQTCLMRQIAAIDGPTDYGGEVDAPSEPLVGIGNECRDMLAAHEGLLDADDQLGIDIDDFAAFLGHVTATLQGFGVSQPDRAAVIAAFTPMCDDILAPANKPQCMQQGGDALVVELLDINEQIPDNAYNGTLESMRCVGLVVPEPSVVADLAVTVGIDHAWLGDITIKLMSPLGTILTLVSRPGLAEPVDDGNGAGGDSSNVLATFPLTFKQLAVNDPEWMGATLGPNSVVCQDDGVDPCDWLVNPGSGPGTSLTDFAGEPADGEWWLCVGDGGAGDEGTLRSAKLAITKL